MSGVEQWGQRRCAKDLIQILEQLPARFAVRSPMVLDEESLIAVAMWTMLRWERTPLMVGLEDMVVDFRALTREIDALLVERQRVGDRLAKLNVVVHQAPAMLDHRINQLLDKVQAESQALGHEYLGAEHLLLAIIVNADPNLSAILSRFGVTRDRITKLSGQLLSNDLPPYEDLKVIADRRGKTGGEAFSFTSWDSEAAGVPRRFGMSVMFMMMTMYALLFAFMKVMGTPPVVFGVIAIFVTGVGFAQMALFGSRYPRAASIWGGAVLFPIEIAVLIVADGVLSGGASAIVGSIGKAIGYAIPCAPLGAFFGYLSGGLTAGAFLVIDMFGPKDPPPQDEPPPDADSIPAAELVPEDDTEDNGQ